MTYFRLDGSSSLDLFECSSFRCFLSPSRMIARGSDHENNCLFWNYMIQSTIFQRLKFKIPFFLGKSKQLGRVNLSLPNTPLYELSPLPWWTRWTYFLVAADAIFTSVSKHPSSSHDLMSHSYENANHSSIYPRVKCKRL